MQISFSPIRHDAELIVSKAGDVLTINGEAYDFSSLPDGATIPAGEVPCEWIIGPVERIAGELHLTLLMPHGLNPPAEVAFPATIVTVPDGEVMYPRVAPLPDESPIIIESEEESESQDVDA
jgi:hypothetical protein